MKNVDRLATLRERHFCRGMRHKMSKFLESGHLVGKVENFFSSRSKRSRFAHQLAQTFKLLTHEMRKRPPKGRVFGQGGGVDENRTNGALDLCEMVQYLASKHQCAALSRTK